MSASVCISVSRYDVCSADAMNMFSFSVSKEAEDHFSKQMAQRMFHESGQDGRSGEVREQCAL